MLPCRLIVVCLFSCAISTADTQRLSRGLFPVASRIKSGLVAMVDPTFHHSFNDVHLFFEILLAGVHFEASGQLSVKDAELASLRKTRDMGAICEEMIPRKLTDIRRLTSHLSSHLGHLHQEDFERILLTMIYATQQMANSTSNHQRDVWAESFVNLYKAIKQDLYGTN